jgi:hypothetical protein
MGALGRKKKEERKKKDKKRGKEKKSNKIKEKTNPYPATSGIGLPAIRRFFFKAASRWAVDRFSDVLGAEAEAAVGLTLMGTTRSGGAGADSTSSSAWGESGASPCPPAAGAEACSGLSSSPAARSARSAWSGVQIRADRSSSSTACRANFCKTKDNKKLNKGASRQKQP